MFGLFRRSPTRLGGLRGRTFLRVESLESRYQPDAVSPLPPGSTGTDSGQIAVPSPPQIQNFAQKEVGNGLFQITGQVSDASPGNLTIKFGGDTSASGQTCTTLADGTFIILIQLRVDGTDSGMLTATVTDGQGMTSSPVQVFLDPTSP